MERRQHPRIQINNPLIVVSDGMGPSQGLVSDISASGLRIIDLPKRLDLDTNQLSVIFSEDTILFRMNVAPKWHREKDGRISMGVKITNIPLRWTDFILKHEPFSP